MAGSPLSREPYGNKKVYHPDGELMFYCSEKLMRWYLDRDLADTVDNGEGIKLRFTPAGKGEDDRFLTPRENICVVSGKEKDLTKHHVIPTQFRKHFPLKYKSKNSHDVVVMTRKEHNKYERKAYELKRELEEKYLTSDEIDFNRDVNFVQKSSYVLSKYDIPDDKREILISKMNVVLEKRGWKEDDIFSLEEINLSKLVVERVGVENMIRLWKSHFFQTTKPKFLPDWWDPGYVKKVRGENI